MRTLPAFAARTSMIWCVGGLAAALLAPSPAIADWGSDGVRVSPLAGQQQFANIAPDGVGGWYVSWIDNADYDLYVQRLDAEGSVVPGWPTAGFPVCTAPFYVNENSMIQDGMGGAFLVWSDVRNAFTTEYDIFLQRILPTGEIAPGWPVNGLPVCMAVGNQYAQRMATDDAGGVVIVRLG